MSNHFTALDDEFPFRIAVLLGTFEAKSRPCGKRCGFRMPFRAGERVTIVLVLRGTRNRNNPSNGPLETVTACGHLTAYRYLRTPSARPDSTRRVPEANRLNGNGRWCQSCVCDSANETAIGAIRVPTAGEPRLPIHSQERHGND